MNKTSKFFTIIITGMMFLMLAAVLAVSVAATNIDSDFTFMLAGNQDYTTPRPKDNATSMYIHSQSQTVDRYKVYAGMINEYSEFDNAAIDTGETPNKTRKYWMQERNKRYLMNFVIERGYDIGYIQSECEVIGTAYGVWSPDSVYQQDVLDKYGYFQEAPIA